MALYSNFEENLARSLAWLAGNENEMNCADDVMTDCFHSLHSSNAESNGLVQVPFKASGQRMGSKLRQKALRTRGGIDNNAAVNSVLCRKVVKRRCSPQDTSKPILYVFPSFDRSDALLFLPYTLVTHINTSDFDAMSKLFQTNFDKKCKFENPFGPQSIASLMDFHQLTYEVHPDSIFCVHSVKVVENKIIASIYAKYTANKAIYEAVSQTVKDPLFVPMFGVHRAQHLKTLIELSDRTEEEKDSLNLTIDSNDDYVVFVHMECGFTYDDFTKKITQYDMSADFTSFEPVARVVA